MPRGVKKPVAHAVRSSPRKRVTLSLPSKKGPLAIGKRKGLPPPIFATANPKPAHARGGIIEDEDEQEDEEGDYEELVEGKEDESADESDPDGEDQSGFYLAGMLNLLLKSSVADLMQPDLSYL